ncbi:MAG: 1-acyl-sn-glycerol-3-phosphate acyltransferase [Bacteroidales bacterium]|jgi:putative hemolysin|nr:1-acyl-sn-glycerol-3-phosphate acyltransferase [Bacteroidales bacterium]
MNQTEIKIKYLDIEKRIRESDSKLLKSFPHFFIRFLSWLVQENEMNRILNKLSDTSDALFLEKVIEEFEIDLQIEGLENLPEKSKCFFVANHPFGVIDGLILTHIVCQKYGTLKAIGNEAFTFIPQLKPLIAMVNVYDRTSREYILELEKIYQSDTPMTHFPAGEVSRLYHWKVQDAPWQKSFIGKSISCQRDIVPFHFYGRNSIFFYTIFVIRRLFGVKLNLELSLLTREMFKKRGKSIKIKIGKPIPYQTFDKSSNHYTWAQKVREIVYGL